MENNGQMPEIEVMPDYENEIVEEMPQSPPPKKEGCGCNKNKVAQASENDNQTNWGRIALIVGGLIAVYFIFGKKGKVEVPKVEVPEV